jgi:anti-anti-sigma factor
VIGPRGSCDRTRVVTRDEFITEPVAGMPFGMKVAHEGDVVRVCPLGDVDIDTVDAIRRRIEDLKAAGARRVVLDLREATFLDSTGVHLVVEADADARKDGWDFALIEGPAGVQRPLEVLGLREHLLFLDPSELSDGRWRRHPRA